MRCGLEVRKERARSPLVVGRRARRLTVLPQLVAAAVSAACFAPAPTLSQRDKSPPFVIGPQVVPPLMAVYRLPDGNIFDFVVAFRSEDQNEQIRAAMYLDLAPGDEKPQSIYRTSAPPGVVEEERQLTGSVTLSEGLASGCHSISMAITQETNFNIFESELPTDPSLAAWVIWWINVPDPNKPSSIDDCPGAE